MLEHIKHYHFIGIGGSGMSAIAKILLQMGYIVSGSDLHNTEITKKLVDMGASITVGHKAENVNGAEAVVVSTAISKDNPEVLAAREQDILIVHRSDVLAALMRQQDGIAVAGAHGKTTTTSMIALVLEKCGVEPTVIIGGELAAIGGNAKLGKGRYLVAEADESDGSFLKLDSKIAVVTNIEDDHLDYYGSRENIVAAFQRFLTQLPSDGVAVLCYDNQDVRKVANYCAAKVVSYAIGHEADYTLGSITTAGPISKFEVYYKGQVLGTAEISVPGTHNIQNSLAAIAVAMEAGLPFEQIAAALTEFRGAKRRFETKGVVNGVWIVDDYAHHPTEISATLQAAEQTNPKRLIVAFQPHRYSRTKLLKNEFAQVFGRADKIIMTEIYSAGEQPIEGTTGEALKNAVEQHEKREVTFIPDKDKVAEYLSQYVETGDLVITMGAGNIWMEGEKLVDILSH